MGSAERYTSTAKGDRQVEYGAVLDVMKACREVGFNNVGLIAAPKKAQG